MCNMARISKKKENILNEINQTLMMSRASIISIKKEIEDLDKKADDNMRILFSLL